MIKYSLVAISVILFAATAYAKDYDESPSTTVTPILMCGQENNGSLQIIPVAVTADGKVMVS